MVKVGHRDVIDIAYRNPDRPRLGIEVLPFDVLRRRLKREVARTASRTDFHQLLLVRGGEATMMVDFVPQPCAPGRLLHVRPGQVQRFPADAEGHLAELDAVLVLFTAAFPPRLPQLASLLDGFGPAAWTLSPGDHQVLDRAMAEIAAEYHTLEGYREDTEAGLTVPLLRQLLGAVLLRLARLPHPDRSTSAEAGDEVFRAFRYELERSFAATRSVQRYAAQLGYSPRTLTRACQAATGRTAKELIDARAALEAQRLLVHTDLPVAAIGRMLGFSEPANFGKFFARETGDAPGGFRTRWR
ncbi:AraC family transcriptional regulator [Streptomyces naganishii]|uniref:Transcriptional regulator n=1 Tax=Streptomyces naganishii JCM 4654 TaxID=1306179 RepID=A0A918Y0J6_9ACTN|nr:helix-turn-helix domain-containing protein [Streptomyces naganishii]GHD86994.1 transcriptional regulator [Streptomyces naganishii JCM 4654]